MTAIMNSRPDCVYCHAPFTETNRPQRDRKDTNGEYTVENVVLACRDCNVIKGDVLTYEEMLFLGPIVADLKLKRDGGEGEIRTPGPRKGTTVFETAAIDHSATSPRR